jgi:hypothetical protein
MHGAHDAAGGPCNVRPRTSRMGGRSCSTHLRGSLGLNGKATAIGGSRFTLGPWGFIVQMGTLPHLEAKAPKPIRRDRPRRRPGPPKLERAGAPRRWSAGTASIPILHCDRYGRGKPQDRLAPLGGCPLHASNPCRRRLQECVGHARSADTPAAKTHLPRLAASSSIVATTSEVLKYGPSVRCPTATPPHGPRGGAAGRSGSPVGTLPGRTT